MMYRTMWLQAIDTGSSSYSGGFGKWLHLGTSSPLDTDIVTPNNDSPYSYAWVDTRAEPWVLTMPKVEEDRFYTSQWDDLWGFVLDNPGSVEDGNGGVTVMLASPSWSGEVPAGVARVIQGDTDFLGSLTRTQLIAPADLANVERIQGEYQLQPLSAFLGRPAPEPAPEVEWMPWTEGAEKTDQFWAYVNFLLSFTSPNPQDEAVQDRMAKLGLGAGRPWDVASLDKDVRDAISAGMRDALAEMAEASKGKVDASTFFCSREDLNKNYFGRAMGVFMGIFGNVAAVSVYFSIGADDQGEQFDGSRHDYVLTFAADQIPPARNFWSMTMYKLPQRWLVDNPIDRYAIGSATPGLQTAADGSISIYVQAESPGEDQRSNWLPAPDGPCWMVLRVYGPDESILNGSWQVAPVNQES